MLGDTSEVHLLRGRLENFKFPVIYWFPAVNSSPTKVSQDEGPKYGRPRCAIAKRLISLLRWQAGSAFSTPPANPPI